MTGSREALYRRIMAKSHASARPLSVSLMEGDRATLFRLSSAMSKKAGKQVKYSEVIRSALACLAEKEGV